MIPHPWTISMQAKKNHISHGIFDGPGSETEVVMGKITTLSSVVVDAGGLVTEGDCSVAPVGFWVGVGSLGLVVTPSLGIAVVEPTWPLLLVT